MALYGNIDDLEPSDAPAFGEVFTPGQTVKASGIYACRACGLEVVSTVGNTLPPHGDDVHHHPAGDPITWRLVCAPDNDRAERLIRMKQLAGIKTP